MRGREDSGRPAPSGLTGEERKALLALARSVITRRLGLDASAPDEAALPAMKAGAFVTLHENGALRGCIGRIESDEPLADVVREVAQEAAFGDRRFPPLTAREWPHVTVELSVMTPPVAVVGCEAIDIPRQGVVMVCQGRRGVFLPQVAAERGWDRETTLAHLAMKIGLEPDAWREGATFSVFEADVFGE